VTPALRLGRRATRDPWRPARATVVDRIENRCKGIVLLVVDVDSGDESDGFRTTVVTMPSSGRPVAEVGDRFAVETRFGRRSARVAIGSAFQRFLHTMPEWPLALG
jgi:hypothetical protein